MKIYNKEYFKQLIAKNQIENLIEELFKYFNHFLQSYPDSKIQSEYDSLIIISGRYSSLKQEQKLGIIESKEFQLNVNILNKSLLDIVNGLPLYFFNFLNKGTIPSSELAIDIRSQTINAHNDSFFEYDAFFSFSTEDLKEAKFICDELRGYGLKIFLSNEALKVNTGTSFFEKIDVALNRSKHFILLSSANSMKSEWVKTEYETFYNEYYIKNVSQRRFIILKGKHFLYDAVPNILKRLQFANSSKEVIVSLLNKEKPTQKPSDFKKKSNVQEKSQGTHFSKKSISLQRVNPKKTILTFFGIILMVLMLYLYKNSSTNQEFTKSDNLEELISADASLAMKDSSVSFKEIDVDKLDSIDNGNEKNLKKSNTNKETFPPVKSSRNEKKKETIEIKTEEATNTKKTNSINIVDIVGIWNISYDYDNDCLGNTSQAVFEVKSDYSFKTDDGYSGKVLFNQSLREITFRYDNGRKYRGKISENGIVKNGEILKDNKKEGCWNSVKK
jgi:hypothetical protein